MSAMNGDALDRAAWAAFRVAAGVTRLTETQAQRFWEAMNEDERNGWRIEAAAAMRGMADDLRREAKSLDEHPRDTDDLYLAAGLRYAADRIVKATSPHVE